MAFRHTPALGAVALSLLLAACGGGGGSAAPTDSGGSPASATGLVPTPSAPGATLVADATTLRPLIAGARWIYSGTVTANGVSTAYTDTVSQTASGGAFVESGSNAFNDGVDTSTESVVGTAIMSHVTAPIIAGPPQQLEFTELQSPVRQNDQVTVLDQHYADIGADFDGDGKNDAGDIGIYRVVVGMEDVAMPNGTTQHAVRVDMIGMIRVTLSSTGAVMPATQAALQSTWYAPSIGIVKQRLTTPASATSNDVAEEILTYFDGITTGYGVGPATEVRLADNASVGAGQPLSGVSAAVAFPDHAVLIGTYRDTVQGQSYIALNSVDSNGNATSTSLYTNLTTTNFLALAGQVAAVQTGSGACQAQILHFDANGAHYDPSANTVITMPPAPGAAMCNDVTALMAASDADRLWLAMVRHSIGSNGWVTDIVVQPFDAQGTPLASETSVLSVAAWLSDTVSLGGVALRSISAAGGKAVISYANDPSGSIELASITDSGVLSQHSVAPTTASSAGPTLLATPSAAAMLWQGPYDISSQVPALGVLLDSGLVPQLSSGATGIDSQTLAVALNSGINDAQFLNGAGDTILVGSLHLSSGSPPSATLASYSSNGQPLSSQPVTPIQLDLTDVASVAESIGSVRWIPLSDRLLVAASTNGQVVTKVVWLP